MRCSARANVAAGLLLLLPSGCGGDGSGPSSPSPSRLQVAFTSQAPDPCPGACFRLAWIDQGTVASQGLIKLAVQVQNMPARGIDRVDNILRGKTVNTFADPSDALIFNSWNPGDFFERVGKPVRYEASDIGTVLMNCCVTTYSVGFANPAPSDHVSGDGTIIVLIYRLRQAGSVDLDPGVGILSADLATSYPARVQITGS